MHVDPYKKLFRASLQYAKLVSGVTVGAVNFAAIKYYGDKLWSLIDGFVVALAPSLLNNQAVHFIVFVTSDALIAFTLGAALTNVITTLPVLRRRVLGQQYIEGYWLGVSEAKGATHDIELIAFRPMGADVQAYGQCYMKDGTHVMDWMTQSLNVSWPNMTMVAWQVADLGAARHDVSVTVVQFKERDGQWPIEAQMRLGGPNDQSVWSLKRITDAEAKSFKMKGFKSLAR